MADACFESLLAELQREFLVMRSRINHLETENARLTLLERTAVEASGSDEGTRTHWRRPSMTSMISPRRSSRASLSEPRDHKALDRSKLDRMFRQSDLDTDGFITAEEIKAVAEKHGIALLSQWHMERVRAVVNALRVAAISRQLMDDDAWCTSGVPFEAFVEMMCSESFLEDIDGLFRDDVNRLQDYFRSVDMNTLIADRQQIEVEDLRKKPQRRTTRQHYIHILDVVICFVIAVNALVIGISLNSGDAATWTFLEMLFLVAYILELTGKAYLIGVLDFFFGRNWHWHMFDTVIVAVGVTDVICKFAAPSIKLSGFLLARLLRLTRIMRLIKHVRFFKELSVMVAGLLSGLKTIFWAMVLMVILIYSIAILVTRTVGRDADVQFAHQEFLFGSITNSMFTIFTCLTESCTSPDGKPISLVLSGIYGIPFMLTFVAIKVVVMFGFFNLIMSVVVENTFQVARVNDQQIEASRHQENLRVARNLRSLIYRTFSADPDCPTSTYNESAGLLRYLPFVKRKCYDGFVAHSMQQALTKKQFDEVLLREDTQAILDELEVDIFDRGKLFDVLDSDGSGSVTVDEAIRGIMELRGHTHKSDIIATKLAVKTLLQNVRDIQRDLKDDRHHADEISDVVRVILKRLDHQLGPCSRSNGHSKEAFHSASTVDDDEKHHLRNIAGVSVAPLQQRPQLIAMSFNDDPLNTEKAV